MTKHDAVHAFFREKAEEIAQDTIGFNFLSGRSGSMSIVTNYSDKIRKRYIRSDAEKEYGFSIIITKPYSMDEDMLNLEAMNFAQGIADWVDEQNRMKNYPEFPENCQIKGMETLQNMPNLAGINYKEGLARYMIQCRIIYFERRMR